MNAALHDLIIEALRAYFLLSVPLLVGLSISGMLASVLQAATSIQEEALQFSVKVMVLLAMAYFFFPAAGASMMRLAELAFR